MEADLERIDQLALQQEQKGKEIQKIVSNIRKDSASRKTEQYFKERVERIKALWQEICDNHKVIAELNFPGHNYTRQNYFEQLTKGYNDAIEVIVAQQVKVKQQAQEVLSVQSTNQGNLLTEERVLLRQLHELLDDVDMELNDEVSIARSRQLQNKITRKWQEITSNFIQLEMDDNHQVVKATYKQLESRHEKMLLTLEERCGAIHQIPTSTSSKQCSIVLPKIKLPIFDGRYDEWTTFRDIFTKVVHENNTLTDIEKMQYLKTHIKGEASRIIQHLQITSSNYTTSWGILSDRYSNERLLVTKLINKILDFPTITIESTFKLKQLHDTTTECLEALKNLNIDTSTWGPIINILVSKKWDAETNKLYEQSLDEPHKVQQLDKLMKFLRTRFQSLEAVSTITRNRVNHGQADNQTTTHTSNNGATFRNMNNVSTACPCCKKLHSLMSCPKFQAMPEATRLEFVKGKKICINCLSHDTQTKCHSKQRCQKCSRFHHTLIHIENYQQENHYNKSEQPRYTNQRQSSNIGRHNETVMLATAMVRIPDLYGVDQLLRILVDPGSQSTFITEEAAKALALPRQRIQADVTGLGGGTPHVAKWKIDATIKPRFSSNFNLSSSCIILPKLTHPLPSRPLNIEQSNWENELLADPTFDRPGPIDIILGAKEYGEIILEGLKKNRSGLLGQKTELGWILSGTITVRDEARIQVNGLISLTEEDQQLLTKFWELEEIQTEKQLSLSEQYVEEHYKTNTTRNNDGSYTVRLPVNENVEKLGQSKSRAVARLLQLEKRLAKDPELETNYKNFMQEYLSRNHMEISDKNVDECNKYYIPHQPVIKESSTTTKLRVVFDASCKTTTGISLNDTMFVGPKLQQELSDIILRWRCHKIVITADIEKMYRQIKIHPDDQRYQTILWRFKSTEPIQEYRLTTVTYGTTSAPYLAIKTTQQLAEDEKKNYPKASLIAKRDFYVDDLLTGTDTIEEAVKLQTELIKMFKTGGFTLRKWSSNSKTVLKTLDAKMRDQCMFELTEEPTRKSLGILWSPHDDTFEFKIKIEPNQKLITKRHILSEVAKLFDPLGWLTPVIITAKIMIQELWLQALKWDDPVPERIQAKWTTFQNELGYLEKIKIPRWTNEVQGTDVEIHGFCDASEKAYGAVVYIKVDTKITLLTSKSKVAPIKTKASLPRLELCSAVLLAKLIKRAMQVRPNQDAKVFAWTDSMIALSWIKGEPHKWKTFVANRVSEINSLVCEQHWNHVRSEENPADIISRGIEPSKLVNNDLWWHGPKWLQSAQHLYNPIRLENPQILLPEEEVRRCHTIVVKEKGKENTLILRFSSFTKLLRVTAWCQKFINNCKTKTKRSEPLTVEELDRALNTIVILEQISHYKEEISALQRKNALHKNSSILNLNPFLDNNGVLRVGGRLQNSQLPYKTRHPMILPYHCHLTKLVIQNAHETTLHGGNQLTLAYTRNKFWVINGKRAVKAILNKCIKCARFKAQAAGQIMGNLPNARVSQSHPFYHTGVDYAGPIQIKTTKGRGYKAYKGYIALFVCFATKAVHIEVVSDMTTETFLAAFKRFIARRGRCAHIYSDNGTNFVGASKILHQEIHEISKMAGIGNELASMGTQWHFNPPSAPHFGGLWEAGVKSMKYHLKRVIGETRLTFEELTTLTHQIEASLNSRPLCPIGNDPNDIAILTPGHFLIGRPLVEPPDPIETPVNSSSNERWRLLQKIKKDIWKKWTSEYLHQLQQRSKWKQQQTNLKVGEVVLLKEQDINPSKWPLAKITQVHSAQDNTVRVVTVKKAEGAPIKRPIHKLIPLPREEDVKQGHARTKPSRLWKIVLTAILFMVTLQNSTAQKYDVRYPPPGLYIEHVGHAKIDRGTFRMEVRFGKDNLTTDTRNIKESIKQLSHLCERARELATNTQCLSLVHHLEDKEKQIEWIDSGLKNIVSRRTKRGLIGKLLTSVFGVNDEVYVDIEKLDKNQQELIRTSNHQTKFMLHALTTFNDTEVRINNQLKQFQTKVNKALEVISDMSHWYKTVDENQLNIHILSAYQTVANYIDEVIDYQKRLLDVHYHRDHLFELISPSHVEEAIALTSRKLPTNIQIISYPILKTQLNHSSEFIHVYGYFIITEVTSFTLLQATPIPLKVTQKAYWILDVPNESIAVNYDVQLYFQLSMTELNNCIDIGSDSYVCSPSAIKNIETSPNCIIDELFQRTENTTCPVHKGNMQSLIWKQLTTPNAWLCITGTKAKVAVICDGIRDEVILNQTSIIQISQNCIIKTNKNILVAKRFKTATVLGAAITPARININWTETATNPKFIIHTESQDEPVITSSDTLSKLRDEEARIRDEQEQTHWTVLHHEAKVSNIMTYVLLTGTLILLGTSYFLYLKNWRQIRPSPSTETPTEQGIQLEPLRIPRSPSASIRSASRRGQNV